MRSRSRQLRRVDWARLLEVVPGLYSAVGGADRNVMGRHIVAAMPTLVSGVNSATVMEFDRRTYQMKLIASARPDGEPLPRCSMQDWIEFCMGLMAADRTYRPVQKAAAESTRALVVNDMLSKSQRDGSAVYCESYRPRFNRHQLIYGLQLDEGRSVFISAFRHDAEFSQREAELLTVFGAQVLRAKAAFECRGLAAFETEPVRVGVGIGGTGVERAGVGSEAGERVRYGAMGLTARQAEVLYWIVQGKRDGEIAMILGTSCRTINHHVGAILQALKVENRASAIHVAVTGGE